VGDFVDGLKHGQGKWQKGEAGSITSYEGEYKRDKKHGYGIFHWASGNLYKGNFKDDERHGRGIMIWTDGSTYDGEWERGIQHGMGKMSFPDGTEKEGYFQDNVYRGSRNPNEEEEIVNPKLLSRPSFVFKKTMKGSES